MFLTGHPVTQIIILPLPGHPFSDHGPDLFPDASPLLFDANGILILECRTVKPQTNELAWKGAAAPTHCEMYNRV